MLRATTYAVGNYVNNYMPLGSIDETEMPNEFDIYYSAVKSHSNETTAPGASPASPIYYGAYCVAQASDTPSVIHVSEIVGRTTTLPKADYPVCMSDRREIGIESRTDGTVTKYIWS
jgi:hypothetical protein